MKNKASKGFTLIEVLVVMGIIAILAAVVLVAINPARQFAQARNSQRTSNVNAILNAIGQNMADNKGTFCSDISVAASSTEIGSGAGQVDLYNCLVPTFLPDMPYDPVLGATTSTRYGLLKDANGRFTVTAMDTELVATDISVTR